MADADRREQDRRYRDGYLTGFKYATFLSGRGVSSDDLHKFIAEDLRPWEQRPGDHVPPPGFKLPRG